ncbi:MAG: hypothetical protein AAFV69_01825 [Pseudomonadota bacterium]
MLTPRLDHVQEKCKRFSARNMNQNTRLECVFDPIKDIISLASLSFVSLIVIATAANARELPFARYAQEPRAIMALAIAIQELNDCDGDLAFSETDVPGGDGTSVLATVSCERFPGENGTMAKATVVIEMGVDAQKAPIGPTSFEYNLP